MASSLMGTVVNLFTAAKSSQSPELLISGAIAIITTLNTVFLNFQTISRTA